LPSWPGTMILLISTSQVARIAGVNHCHPIWFQEFSDLPSYFFNDPLILQKYIV
jgi:hypothetical protein